MKRCAIYARVSTTDKGQDTETQLIPLREFVKARGWYIAEEFIDQASGAKENRPELQRMMDQAKKRKIDMVIVFRFDRFARSTKHLISSLELFQSLGIDFISYSENIDTSTPAGKVMFTMVAAFSEFERSIIQERVKAGLARAKSQGKLLGRPKKKIDVNALRELREKGLSVRKIAESLGISKSLACNYLK